MENKKLLALTTILLTLAFGMTARAETKTIINGVYINTQESAIEITEAPPINRISTALDEVDAFGNKLEYLGNYTITFYCPCKRCNGSWGAIDGFGNPLVWGTVAVDPHDIPMGTQLVVDGYDMIFTARDTGSGVNGKHIDMFVPVSHSEALAMPQGSKVKVWKYHG